MGDVPKRSVLSSPGLACLHTSNVGALRRRSGRGTSVLKYRTTDAMHSPGPCPFLYLGTMSMRSATHETLRENVSLPVQRNSCCIVISVSLLHLQAVDNVEEEQVTKSATSSSKTTSSAISENHSYQHQESYIEQVSSVSKSKQYIQQTASEEFLVSSKHPMYALPFDR